MSRTYKKIHPVKFCREYANAAKQGRSIGELAEKLGVTYQGIVNRRLYLSTIHKLRFPQLSRKVSTKVNRKELQAILNS